MHTSHLLNILTNNPSMSSSKSQDRTDENSRTKLENEKTKVNFNTPNSIEKNKILTGKILSSEGAEILVKSIIPENKTSPSNQENFMQRVLYANIPPEILSDQVVKDFLQQLYDVAPFENNTQDIDADKESKEGPKSISLNSCFLTFMKIFPHDFKTYEGIISIIWHMEQIMLHFSGEFPESLYEEKFNELKNTDNSEKKYIRGQDAPILCLNAHEHHIVIISSFLYVLKNIRLDKKDKPILFTSNLKIIKNAGKHESKFSKTSDMTIFLVENVIKKWIHNKLGKPVQGDKNFRVYLQNFMLKIKVDIEKTFEKMHDKGKRSNSRTKRSKIIDMSTSHISWYTLIDYFRKSPPAEISIMMVMAELFIHLEVVDCIHSTNPEYWKNIKHWKQFLDSWRLIKTTEIFKTLEDNSRDIYYPKLLQTTKASCDTIFDGIVQERETSFNNERVLKIMVKICPRAKEIHDNKEDFSDEIIYSSNQRQKKNLVEATRMMCSSEIKTINSLVDTPITTPSVQPFLDRIHGITGVKISGEVAPCAEIKSDVREKKEQVDEVLFIEKDDEDLINSIIEESDEFTHEEVKETIKPIAPKNISMRIYVLFFCLRNWYRCKFKEHMSILQRTGLTEKEILFEKDCLMEILQKYIYNLKAGKVGYKEYLSFSHLQKHLCKNKKDSVVLFFALIYLESLYKIWHKDSKFFDYNILPVILNDEVTEFTANVVNMIQCVEMGLHIKYYGDMENYESNIMSG